MPWNSCSRTRSNVCASGDWIATSKGWMSEKKLTRSGCEHSLSHVLGHSSIVASAARTCSSRSRSTRRSRTTSVGPAKSSRVSSAAASGVRRRSLMRSRRAARSASTCLRALLLRATHWMTVAAGFCCFSRLLPRPGLDLPFHLSQLRVWWRFWFLVGPVVPAAFGCFLLLLVLLPPSHLLVIDDLVLDQLREAVGQRALALVVEAHLAQLRVGSQRCEAPI